MKVGIVGLGSIGARHYENAVKLGGHTVSGYDPANPPLSTVKYERELYDWADAVVVATPSYHHEAALRACVERGKHVLIEKPISTSFGQLPSLLARAKEKNLVVMMGNNLRFHPSVQRTKKCLVEGRIAPLWANFICATTTIKPDYLSDGVILNTGSHEVDLALYFFGPARVVAATGQWNEHSDDMADFVLLHDSGVRSSFHIDFVTGNEVREFWIGGETGNIHVNLPKRVTVTDDSGRRHIHKDAGKYDDDYIDEMHEFHVKCAGDSSGPGATGDDGLAALRLLLDIRRMVAVPWMSQ
jgi:predicted dehydrogenase